MRITYYKTSSFIQHTGSIIDLAELRRRQAAAQRDSLARQPESVLPWMLDACASLAVVFVTLVFALRILF